MTEYDYKEIDLFIREELSQHGEWLVDRFAEALEKNKNVDTGRLLESLNYTPARVDTDGSISIGISFETYGRAMEIAGRKRRLQQKNSDVWGKKRSAEGRLQSKNHRPKKVQWYNKNRWAGYGRLIRRLSAGISDDELQRIRGLLERARQDFAAGS